MSQCHQSWRCQYRKILSESPKILIFVLVLFVLGFSVYFFLYHTILFLKYLVCSDEYIMKAPRLISAAEKFIIVEDEDGYEEENAFKTFDPSIKWSEIAVSTCLVWSRPPVQFHHYVLSLWYWITLHKYVLGLNLMVTYQVDSISSSQVYWFLSNALVTYA